MKIRFSVALLIVFMFVTANINAQNYAAAVKISSLGVTLEGVRSIGESFNTRVGVSFFSYSHDGGGVDEDFVYKADLSLLSFALLGDWFPFKNFLRVTGGLVVNFNKLDMNLVPSKSYTVGGRVYTPKDIGDMSASVSFNKLAPYIGLGFGNPTSGKSGLGVVMDFGAVYQGAPGVDLATTGLLAPSSVQGPKIEENLNWFKFYPVFSIGLSYKF